MADEALLAVRQLLTSDADRDARLCVADVGERHPQIERALERRAGRADGFFATRASCACTENESDGVGVTVALKRKRLSQYRSSRSS